MRRSVQARRRTLLQLLRQERLVEHSCTAAVDLVPHLEGVADVHHASRLLPQQAAQNAHLVRMAATCYSDSRGVVADVYEDKLRAQGKDAQES